MRNFSENFWKDVTYDNNDNIKTHKERDFTLSLEDTLFQKPWWQGLGEVGGGIKLTPPQPC